MTDHAFDVAADQRATPAPLILRASARYILDRGLARRQRRAALVSILVPMLGVAAAVAQWPWLPPTMLDLGLFAGFYAISMLGITVGFHRLAAHAAFAAPSAVRAVLYVMGSLAAQGPPIAWATTHRTHHRYSDREGDPHSPHADGPGWDGSVGAQTRASATGGKAGLWHAHIGWMLSGVVVNPAVLGSDLLRDRLVSAISRRYLWWVALGLLMPAAIGGIASGSWIGAWTGLLWGGLVRIAVAHQFTWAINSFTHVMGTRPNDTPERSHNIGLLALPTMGEAWHNHHHAAPGVARFSRRVWQLDPGWWLIWTLHRCGLATDVRRAPPPRRATRPVTTTIEGNAAHA